MGFKVHVLISQFPYFPVFQLDNILLPLDLKILLLKLGLHFNFISLKSLLALVIGTLALQLPGQYVYLLTFFKLKFVQQRFQSFTLLLASKQPSLEVTILVIQLAISIGTFS